MPIVLPNLDDRRWADLVEQGRALIPLYSPDWTDHNASDPGITLMELFAWVAEMDVYRLNRISDRQKRRLLALMTIRPEPPRPATRVVSLRIVSGASPVALPASVELTGTTLDGRAVMFRSTTATNVVASSLRAVQRKSDSGFQNLTAAWTRQEAIQIFGSDPQAGAEVYLGFDGPLPANTWAQLHVQLSGEKAGLEERRRILDGKGVTRVPAHHSAPLDWEYLADAGGGLAKWLPLDVDDDTRSLTLSGAVRLRPGTAMKAQTIGQVAQALYYVRARLAAGAFDEAPSVERLLVNAVEAIQSVPVWQTWPIAAGAIVSGTPIPGQMAGLRLEMRAGSISTLTVDAAPAPAPGSGSEPAFLVLAYVAPGALTPGSLTVQAALAGSGTGEPEQTITLGRRPLVEDTFRLFSLEGTTWRAWERVDDFAASTRASAHVLLDPTTGELTFGDGEHGRCAPAGCLFVAFYEATEAEAATARLSGLADSPRNRVLLPDPSAIGRLTAEQQVAAEEGAPAETLAHALGRAIELREARLRAVTVEDFETIARDTPGTRIARAIARPNLYPGLDCVSAPGVVTVIVLPSLPALRPMPSAGLIQEVAARLEPRRTIGTRVIVTGPRYLEVAVRASLKPFDGIDKARLGRQVAGALDAFFHPLTSGPAKDGWPLGRDVYRAEVMQVIDETPGVDHVRSLELIVEGCAPTCGNVCLRPTWLVAAGPHEIEVL